MTRVDGGSLVTAAGPCRILTGFPILPAEGGHLATVRATGHITRPGACHDRQSSIVQRLSQRRAVPCSRTLAHVENPS
jgi:hypothetical protein